MVEPMFYTTNQLAKLMQRHPQTLRKAWRERGNACGIVPIKLGSRVFWPKREVLRVLGGRA